MKHYVITLFLGFASFSYSKQDTKDSFEGCGRAYFVRELINLDFDEVLRSGKALKSIHRVARRYLGWAGAALAVHSF